MVKHRNFREQTVLVFAKQSFAHPHFLSEKNGYVLKLFISNLLVSTMLALGCEENSASLARTHF